MSTRTPPRFVPTLTEVVDRASSSPQPAAETGSGGPGLAASWITPQMQEAIVQRVLGHVNQSLEPRLADTVAAIARQHSEALAQHLRDRLEDLVTELVAEAVHAELTAGAKRRIAGH